MAAINTTGPMKRRIMDMGITPGVEIKVVKVAPLGNPIEVNVRGYVLSRRKEEAQPVAEYWPAPSGVCMVPDRGGRAYQVNYGCLPLFSEKKLAKTNFAGG